VEHILCSAYFLFLDEWCATEVYLFSILRFMYQFLKRGLILSIPLIVYLVVIVIIDPFNYLKISYKAVDTSVKATIAGEVSPHMYKLLNYRNNPARNIVFGDSRTNALYRSFDSDQWGNLAFGGGTIKEIVDAFWYAADIQELDTVLIGVNLNLYNKFNKRFYVEETIAATNNFFSYAFTKSVLRSSFSIIQHLIFKNKELNYQSSLSKEEFWNFQLTDTPEKFFKKIEYPDNYFRELAEISEYCSTHQTKLIIWIPPTHIEFQNTLRKYNIEELNERFLMDMRSLADVYDYNFPNELTQNRENFRDPLHFTLEIAGQVRDELLAGKPYMANITTCDGQP
jgi:hypothetical protein